MTEKMRKPWSCYEHGDAYGHAKRLHETEEGMKNSSDTTNPKLEVGEKSMRGVKETMTRERKKNPCMPVFSTP